MYKRYFFFIVFLFFLFLTYLYFTKKQNFSKEKFISEIEPYKEQIYNYLKNSIPQNEKSIHDIFNKIIKKFDNHIFILLKDQSDKSKNIVWAFPKNDFKFNELSNELLLRYNFFDKYEILVYNNPYYKKSIFDYLFFLLCFVLILLLISMIYNKKIKYPVFFAIFVSLFFINFSYFANLSDSNLDINFIFFFPLNIFFYIHGIIFLGLFLVFLNLNLKKDFDIEKKVYILYALMQWFFIFFVFGGILTDNIEYILNFKDFLPFNNDSLIYFILFSIIIILVYQLKDFGRLCKFRFLLIIISIVCLLYFYLNIFVLGIFAIIFILFLSFIYIYNRIALLVILFFSLCMMFFIEIELQWTKTKEIVKDFSGFIFDNDLEKYKDPDRMILSIPYIKITEHDIEIFNLPYMYLNFFNENKDKLLNIKDSIEVGSFFYRGDKFYFVFLNYDKNKYFFPFLEKNLQFWIDNYQIFGTLPEEISSIVEYSNRFFPIHIGEFYNGLYKGTDDIFFQRLINIKKVDDFFNYVDRINDDNLDGHNIVIYISNINIIELLAFIFKASIFIFGIFLLYYFAELSYVYGLNFFKIINSRLAYKYVFLEFLVLIISFVILYFVLFFYLNFIIIAKDMEQYKRANKEVDNYFRFNIDNYINKIRAGTFEDDSSYFYLFDNKGRLLHTNNKIYDDFFDDNLIKFIEVSWENSYSLYYYRNKIFIVSVYPEYDRNVFLGKIALFYKLSYRDIMYMFNTLNVKFAIYHNGERFYFPINYSEFPDLLNYKNYMALKERNNELFFLSRDNIYFLLEPEIKDFFNNTFFLYKSEFNYEVLYSLYDKFFIVFVIILILFSIIIIFWNRKISYNTELIIKKLPLILQKGNKYKIDIKGNDEIAKIAKTINFLSDNLEKERKKVFELEKDRLINQFSREIAHEIKNPLTPMKLSIQHLMDLYRIDKQQFLKRFPEIAKQFEYSIDLLASLSRKFLDMAKLDVGELTYIDPVDVIKDIISFFNSKKIDFIKFENKIPYNIEIKANKDSLYQVFVNIINNSIQACYKEGCYIVIKMYSKDNRLIIDIIDNGKGVDGENINKIFEPYFTTKRSGSGLGLAISKKFIELMGGEIIAFNLSEYRGFVVRITFYMKEGNNEL